MGQTLINPLQVVVTKDGAPAANATVTWSTTAAGGSLNPSSAVTDANGAASSSWTLGTVSGPQSAQASLSGATGSPVSFTATAAPGAATSLSDAAGNGQTGVIGTQLAALVQAKVGDEFGNGVAGVDVGWTATGATVSAATVISDEDGISGVNVTLGGIAGPVTITATADGLIGSPLNFTATATTAPTTAEVNVVNNSFDPSTLTISPGTTVVWTWAPNAIQHNVVSVGGLFPGSGAPVNGPHTYQFKFDAPGTYNYFCEVHGSPTVGMRGSIVVQ